jgi:Concanavalin A-like lectin/glucanases superfamily
MKPDLSSIDNRFSFTRAAFSTCRRGKQHVPAMKRRISGLITAVALGAGFPLHGSTVAYWRFEEGPANALLYHTVADGVYQQAVADSSGNGNGLSAWSSGAWASSYYRNNTLPTTTIPQTGAANDFCVKNAGGFPGMFTDPAAAIRTITPAQFTIEAMFKPESGGYRTIVGRDSQGAGTQPGGDPSAAALYFQIQPGDKVAITFQDVSGYQYTAVSAAGLVHGFDYPTDPDGNNGTWYAMAGISDGTTLSLYLDDLSGSAGYQLVAQTLLNQGSPNTALTAGLGSGSDWTAGDWSVGRGLYNGGHVDRGYGYIDEVRISDSALNPGQFLMAIPEPTTGAMILLSLGCLGLIRRRS